MLMFVWAGAGRYIPGSESTGTVSSGRADPFTGKIHAIHPEQHMHTWIMYTNIPLNHR